MSRYTSAKSRPNYTFDAELEFKDAGLVAADGAATVDSAARVVDVGGGRFNADMVIDVSAIEIASGDERYTILIQGSSSPTFASDVVNLAALPLGDASTIATAFGGSGGDVDDAIGRFVLPFTNERNNVIYRYLRIFVDAAGSIATGINFTAFAAPRQ
jgi:hypothetical protein